MRIALLQYEPVWESKEKNFEIISSYLSSHLKPKEVDLLLLPEMFSTGFTMNASSLAEPLLDKVSPTLQQCFRWAEIYESYVVGTWITTDREGNYYNTLHVVSSHHSVVGYYHKYYRFRMAGEDKVYSQGFRPLVVHIKNVPIYFQICYDLRFPNFSMNKKQNENGECWYDIGINLASWPAKRSHHWVRLLQARAIENQVYFIGVNRVGMDGNGIEYSGDSIVVNFHGDIMAHLQRAEGIIKITLDMHALYEYRRNFPVWQDWDFLESD